MTSLVGLLMNTLPFAAADATVRSLRKHAGAEGGIAAATYDDIQGTLTFIPPNKVFPFKSFTPSPDVAREADEESRRIWGWSPSPDAASFGRLTCLVRDSDYASQVVLEELRFGRTDDSGAVLPNVRVRYGNDKVLDLPLSQSFLLQQWYTGGSALQLQENPLWPLRTTIDFAAVRVFVYELTVGGSTLQPIDMLRADKELSAAHLAAMLLQVGLVQPTDPAGPSPLLETDLGLQEPFGLNLFRGDMLPGEETGFAQVTAPSTNQVMTEPVRFVVAVSLTLCRERADFEPGGLVGVGRLYPHIHIAASIPLSRAEASVHFVRPAKTSMPMAHCHAMHDSIENVLVADANAEEQLIPSPAPPPIWSNLFSYYVPDASAGPLGQQALHVVKADALGIREYFGAVYRHPPMSELAWLWGEDLSKAPSLQDVLGNSQIAAAAVPRSWVTVKLPRQGEFDNIHLAPRMTLNAKAIRRVKINFGDPWDIDPDTEPVPIGTNDQLALDPIVMAPFCAHDCFHMHVRWANGVGALQALGWEGELPYRRAGAPMVPLNQDVFFRVPRANELIYSAVINEPIPAGVQQVVCHHGAGYGLSASSYKIWVALTGGSLLGSDDIVFVDEKGADMPGSDWSVFYWFCRYQATHVPGVGWRAVERTIIFDLDAARKL